MKTARTATRDTAALFDRFREAGLGGKVMAEMERQLKQRAVRRRTTVRRAGAVLAVAALLAWAVPYFKDTSSISIPVAERRSLALADGSRAELNAQTELRADFRYGRRTVRLTRGEGFFSVVSDPAHPFLVVTPAGTVRVIGTHFNVRLDEQGRAEVTLVEGRVRLEQAAATAELAPGEQGRLAGGGPVTHPLTAAEMERVLAWREGRIILDGLSVPEAAARFALFHGKVIVVDPSLDHIRLGGTYSLEDLPRFLQALKDTGVVAVLPLGDGSLRLVARP